jgi:hypothetical protein
MSRTHQQVSKVADLGDNVMDEMSMNKEQVIAKLREHEPELKAAGIVRLRIGRKGRQLPAIGY